MNTIKYDVWGATESILECIVGEYCVLCIVLIILLYFFPYCISLY